MVNFSTTIDDRDNGIISSTWEKLVNFNLKFHTQINYNSRLKGKIYVFRHRKNELSITEPHLKIFLIKNIEELIEEKVKKKGVRIYR